MELGLSYRRERSVRSLYAGLGLPTPQSLVLSGTVSKDYRHSFPGMAVIGIIERPDHRVPGIDDEADLVFKGVHVVRGTPLRLLLDDIAQAQGVFLALNGKQVLQHDPSIRLAGQPTYHNGATMDALVHAWRIPVIR